MPVGVLSRSPSRIRAGLLVATLVVALASFAQAARAEDRFDAAVAHAGRSADDTTRDPIDHPAALLRLTGIGPGMRVADIMGGGGYYSELSSYLVGPHGQVLLVNNAVWDKWSADDLPKRLANNRLPNVEHLTVDLDHMNLPAGSLDAIILSKVYHDLYAIDPSGEWPKINVGSVLDQMAQALKPGGVLLLVDHSAVAGHGSADASKLHRIDEAFARQDFEKHGFKVVATSDVLRRPDDARDQVSYKPPALGKTDRFVIVFRKS